MRTMKSLLFIMVLGIAAFSTVTGLLMITYPDGSALHLSTSLLDGTVFKDFLVPGILLVLTVGSVNLLAVFHLIQKDSFRYNRAMMGGVLVCCWIIGQVIVIGVISWFQMILLLAGLMIILVSYQLKGKWAV